MADQHIEREARYEATRLTTKQRDQMIWQLRRKGWSQVKIARHLGMTQPAIHYALNRLAGIPRRTQPRDDFDDEMECDPLDAPREQW
jgi:hypothetical protein